MKKKIVVTNEEILIMLCDAVTRVLTKATQKDIGYSAMVQKINRIHLRPDIGCFVIFDGGFAGLVVINFTSQTAMEIYRDYMLSMGMAEAELSTVHTSDDVSNVLGELMNQIVGDFTKRVSQELRTYITQNQPKMMTITKQVLISVDTNLDRPQARRVTFNTDNNNIFYLELAMDKTEFVQIMDFDSEDDHPDSIFEQAVANYQANHEKAIKDDGDTSADDLLDELGI